MSKPIVIAFSGGCFSGKTTTLKELRETLKARGYSVITLDELVRKYKINSIDALREDPSKYLEFQLEVITGKMVAEKQLLTGSYESVDVVLVDRAITDSLFYLLFYVDKSKLTTYDINLFYSLQKRVIDHIKDAWANIYDLVIEFLPMDKQCNDSVFRPIRIDSLKYVEHDTISMLNDFANSTQPNYCNKLIKWDLNNVPSNALINGILTRFNL